MNKSIKAILSYLGICLFVFFCCSPAAYAVDGSAQTAYNGHLCQVSGSTKSVCANCHIPHGAKGMRIWARGEIQGKTNVVVKDLCASCHYQGNKDFPGIQSGLLMGTAQWNGGKNTDRNNLNGNVFLGGSANHVMGLQLKPNQSDGVSFVTSKAEVLNSNNKNEGVGFPFSATEGFYCGSCHNPHKQPNKDESGNGDYLRYNVTSASAGATHDRAQFCRQCHPQASRTKDSSGNSICSIHPVDPTKPDNQVCDICHRPHDGYPSEANAGVFVYEVPPVNIDPSAGIYGLATNSRKSGPNGVKYESEQCIACHIKSDEWIKAGAPKLNVNHGQHPMLHSWAKTSCSASGCHKADKDGLPHDGSVNRFELDGFNADGSPAPFSQQIFGCTGCHTHHSSTIEGNPSFLDHASFKNDGTAFCEYCHDYPNTDKQGNHPKNHTSLAAGNGKHYKTPTDVNNPLMRVIIANNKGSVKCGGCMFCHFIHQNDKDNDPRIIPTISPDRADIRSLMRVPPVALNWGVEGAPNQGAISLRTDPLDRYEALCYGCHSNENIVGPYEKGSRLNPALHSHRFACAITGKNTNENIGRAGTFPLADGVPGAGPAQGAMDDYGAVKGQIYCGTCHDVHVNNKAPYLYQLSPNDHASPYQSDPVGSTYASQADRKGFCEQCHCTASNSDPMAIGATHPVGADKVPVVPHTSAEFPKQFAGGGSGSPLGITAMNNTIKDGVICLTCHNVHAAATAWDGSAASEPRTSAAVDSNGQKTGKHGQLLVMDNYSAEPGSNMCGACHVSYWGSLGSPSSAH
jgi:hypothetical protein